MKIHQFVHTLHYGDAISSEAITIKRLLAEQGIAGEIYCVNSHPKMKRDARNFEIFAQDEVLSARPGTAGRSGNNERAAVMLHYSIASPLNTLFCERSDNFRLVVYHNLTPERWFWGYNARVVADLQEARRELPAALKAADVILCDSHFNQSEVQQIVSRESSVLPLVLDAAKWDVPENDGIRRVLLGHGGKNILHVGRIAPNKRLEDILKAFYFYHHKVDKTARLWLVGSDTDTEIYGFELRRLIEEFHLRDVVTLAGAVADSELKSFYKYSDLYVCMSEHEGFCVPLIEAMHFGLPVLAFNSLAVGETLEGAGLLLARKAPAETSELIDIVLRDDALRERLIAAGRERVGEFGLRRFSERLNELVVSPVQRSAERARAAV